jgi:hypothetical protein
MDSKDLHDESQPAADEAKAQRIEEENRGLSWCLKHPSGLAVYYDGPFCPACELENENREAAAKVFLEMTKDLP